MDGEQPQTLAPPIAVEVVRRPRVGGRVLVRLFMWSLPFFAGALALFFWLGSGRYIETDNAYVKGDRVYVASELAGPIVEVAVRENQHVSRGQLLYRLDDTPYRLALAKIEADIEIQRAEIRSLRAQWRTKREDIKAALSQQVYAQADFERQKDLADRKFAPVAKLDESRMGAEVARQRIASLEEDLQRIEAQLAQTLAEEDVEHLAAAMDPGSVAAALVYENLWAAPFASAMRRAGGQLIANGRIPIQALIAAIEADAADDTLEAVGV